MPVGREGEEDRRYRESLPLAAGPLGKISSTSSTAFESADFSDFLDLCLFRPTFGKQANRCRRSLQAG